MKNPYPKLKVEWTLVSPEQAIDWLAVDRMNRPVNQGWVGQYAHDIAQGRWGLSESAIFIATDGSCINGQHRLEAVVASEIAIWAIVVTGVPKDAIFDMDQGKKRSFIHAHNLLHAGNGKLTTNAAAAAHYAFSSGPFLVSSERRGQRTPNTHHDRERVLTANAEAVDWLLKHMPATLKNVTTAAVMAPILRAYYSCKRDGKLTRLAEFCNVLSTGESMGPKDSAAVKLRNNAMTDQRFGGEGRAEMYLRAEYALVAFLKGEQITKLLGVTREQFEVPGGP